MATAVARMSLEEFLAQPGETYHDFHELHNGEVVEVPLPTVQHAELQVRIEQLLNELCLDSGYAARREFYLTLLTEARRVDVALVKRARLDEQRRKVFFGSPELVIEILSPSNLAMDLDHLRETCFQDVCLEFWVVNLEFRTVTVYRRDRSLNLYGTSDPIPLNSFGIEKAIPVDRMFEGI